MALLGRMRHVFLLPIVAVLLADVTGCDSICENEQIANVASPSGAARAIVFHRNCGATTGFNTQVSVLPMAKQLPNDGGNALIVDGSVPLQVRWTSESRILVSGYGQAKIFKQESIVGGVAVTYAN